MSEGRCIKWERPYASTGQGHSAVSEWADGALPPPYDAEKDTSIGFLNTYTAVVEPYRLWRTRRRVGGVDPPGPLWTRTLWRDQEDALDRLAKKKGGEMVEARRFDTPALQDRSTYCPESVATERSCRREMDRSVVTRPPLVTLRRAVPGEKTPQYRQWFDKIAPTGHWESTEPEDG